MVSGVFDVVIKNKPVNVEITVCHLNCYFRNFAIVLNIKLTLIFFYFFVFDFKRTVTYSLQLSVYKFRTREEGVY